MGETVPKEWIGEGKEYDFEDMKVIGVENPHEYLTHTYGDYMTPPPINDRNRHNVTKIK